MPDPSSGSDPAKVESIPGSTSTVDHLGATGPYLDATLQHRSAGLAAPLPTIPGFEPLRVLGRGGMGVVYLARQEGLNRLVALKMILSGAHADTLERQRFRREAEAVARLQHPGIVQVHQVGEHEGMPFLVLEYVPGGPLSRHLAGQPQPPDLSAAWVAALADAVAHAHACGIVHRDLKPANVLLAAEPSATSLPGPHQLKITDFGLAKALTGGPEAESPTVTGDVLGTPSYMAPEQAEGRSQDVGPLADVYALGAILYELLTGRPPFRADNALNTLRQVLESEPAPPRALNPGVPRDLEVICLECLRKEPGKRYSSAAALAQDLGRYHRGEPIHARPMGPLERGWRLVRRNPVVSVLTVAVFASLLAGLGFSLHYAHQAGIDATEARSQATRAEAAAEKEARALYLTEMNLAARSFRDGQIAVVRQLLDKWLPGPDQIDRRGPEWSLLQRQSFGALRVLDTDIADARALAWHPSGQLLFRRHGPRFGARNAITGAAVFETELPPLTATLAVRPDGNQVAAAIWGNRLHLINAVNGQQTSTPAFSNPIRAVSYRPDGKELVTGCSDFHVRRHDVATGAVLQTFPRSPVGHHAFVIGADYIPGSSHIVSLDVYRWLIRWDPATGKPVWKRQTETGNIAKALAVHPHRPLAALGFTVSSRHAPDYGYIELRELEHGNIVTSLDCAGGILCIAFNPEGDLLAAAGLDGIVRIWDVQRQQQLAELAGHNSPVAAIAWHPDGWRLASTGDQTLRLGSVCTNALERSWSGSYLGAVLHPRGESLLLLGRGDPAGLRVPLDGPLQKIPIPELSGLVHGGEWSADGRWVALAVDHHVEIRDGKTLQIRHRLPDSPFFMADVRFTPDGEQLVTHNGSGEVCVWESATGKLLRSWKGAPSRGVLAVAPDGERVAILNQSVALFRLDTGARLWEKAASSPIQYSTVNFLPDGQLLVGTNDGEIRVFATTPGTEPVRTLRSGSHRIVGLRAVGGRRLLSEDQNGVLTIWDVESTEVLRALPAENNSSSLVVDPEGRWLVRRVGDRWGLWDLRPLDDSRARRQEALALVDHLAGRCLDRADLLRRVRVHPAVADDVRTEALALASRYDDDAAALQWEVFDVACESGRAAEVYAEQLPRAERAIRALPDQPVPLLARAALRLRLDHPEAANDLRAAEKCLARGGNSERVWLLRLQALEAAQKKRPAEARSLSDRADHLMPPGANIRGDVLNREVLSLIPRQP